jgi:hypothetical protein
VRKATGWRSVSSDYLAAENRVKQVLLGFYFGGLIMNFKKFFKSNKKSENRRLGQATFEYVLISILLSVLVLAGFKTFYGGWSFLGFDKNKAKKGFVEKSRDILKSGFFDKAEDRINRPAETVL